MEPITTATIVTLVLTKAIEKNGEKITEAVWTVAGKLLAKLKEKMPLTGMKLEQVQTNPALMESHPKDFGAEVSGCTALCEFARGFGDGLCGVGGVGAGRVVGGVGV